MRARFAKPRSRTFGSLRGRRLSVLDWIILTSALVGITLMSFPILAFAADPSAIALAKTENKTPLIFEIKNFPQIKIPEIDIEGDFITDGEVKTAAVEVDPVTGKIYMHEPAIKAYVCPKLGDKCKTFIAILKAENGTHECTRDNKGLNRNGSIDVGLAQINWNKKSPYTIDQLRDCKFNLDIAMAKYDARGFSPWVAYTSGSYKKHLKFIN